MKRNITSEDKALSNKLSFLYPNVNYTLTIDKLSVNLTPLNNTVNLLSLIQHGSYNKDTKVIYSNGEMTLKLDDDYRNRYRTKESSYRYVVDIFQYGELTGHLYLVNSSHNSKELIRLEFENHVFYLRDWYSYYQAILKSLNLSLHNIAYIEIAFDTYGKLDMIKELYFNSTSCRRDRFVHVGKSKVGTFNNNEMFLIGLIESTGKSIAVYNKSEEILKSNKTYIRQYHRLNGLDTARDIHRVELRMTNKYMMKYSISLESLATQEGLEQTFQNFTRDSLLFNDKYASPLDGLYHEQWCLIDYNSFAVKKFEKLNGTNSLNTLSKYEIKRNYKALLTIYLLNGSGHALELLRTYIDDDNNVLLPARAVAKASTEDLKVISIKEYLKLTNSFIKGLKLKHVNREIEVRKNTVVADLFHDLNGGYLSKAS